MFPLFTYTGKHTKQRYDVYKFSIPKQISWTSTVQIFGKRGSGKTTCQMNILYHFRKIAKWIVITGNEKYDMYIEHGIPPGCISLGYSEKWLSTWYNKQRKIAMDHGLNKKEQWTPKDVQRYGLGIIVDDLSHHKKFWHGNLWLQMTNNGRHSGCFIMSSEHNIMLEPKAIRDGQDVFVGQRENSREIREDIYKHAFGVFDSFSDFDRLFKKVTTGYHSLVMLNNIQEYDLTKIIFAMKPRKIEDLPRFLVGTPEYRNLKTRLNKVFIADDELRAIIDTT
jgi:hypothetical protein